MDKVAFVSEPSFLARPSDGMVTLQGKLPAWKKQEHKKKAGLLVKRDCSRSCVDHRLVLSTGVFKEAFALVAL